MISITSYAKQKKSSSSNNSGGGGFANAQVYNNGFNPFYLWGQYVDGRDNINGDLISNGTITGNKIVAPQGNIDLIYALSEYVNYISGHTAIFDNLSGDTAHFNQDVFVGGDIDIVGDTNITGDTTIYGDLNVSGDTHLKDVWTQNINNSDTIKTKNLEVTGLAHFFQLVIDRIKAAGGAILLTPADGFETALVEEDESGYTLYFHAKDGEKQISNMWEVNDQAICQTFNASTGTSYNVSNTYYWALVTDVSEQAVQKTVSGVTEEYHYIKLSKSVYDGELNPKVGDEIAMLGSRNENDPQRQSAIYMAAYVSLDQGLTAPLFAEYKGINDFSLSSHRHSYIDATGASFTGDFRIDNNTTIQDYVNSATTEVRNEFRFNEEGLYSRVSKLTNPNILAANGWVDQNDDALYQEDDEEYLFEQEEQSLAKGGGQIESEEEEYIGIPPIIYLNADTYTFSTYSRVKYENIKYGVERDNLDQTISAFTGCNTGDTWHGQARMICTFEAPINGYYQFGMKLMDSGYTGDYTWVDPDPVPSGITPTPDSGYTPTPPADIIYTEVELTMNKTTLLVNESGHTLSATVTTSDNQPYIGDIRFSSSNPSAATVDQNGNITIVGTGTTVFTATVPGGYVMGKHYSGSSDTLNVTVTDTIQTSLQLTISAVTDAEQYLAIATVSPSGYPGTVTYSSSDPSTATVDQNGNIAVIGSGSTTITATAPTVTQDGITWSGSTATGQVAGFPVQSIVITNDTPPATVYSGQTVYLNASANPETTLTYANQTSPTSFLPIDENGVITVLAPGWGNFTVAITAQGFTDYLNHIVYATTTKTVAIHSESLQEEYINLSVQPPASVEVGDTIQLEVSSSPETTLTFTSSDPTIATIDSNGLISGVSTGDTTITVTAEGFVNYETGVKYPTVTTSFTATVEERDMFVMKALEPTDITVEGIIPLRYKVSGQTGVYNWLQSGTTVHLNTGQAVKIYNQYPERGFEQPHYFHSTGNYEVMGDISTVCGNNDFAAYQLFSGDTKLINASGMTFPNTISDSMLYGLFQNCTNLQHGPNLIVSHLGDNACESMYKGCTSLKETPVMSAQTSDYEVYKSCFSGCTSLTEGTVPCAGTLVMNLSGDDRDNWYQYLFAGCSNLEIVRNAIDGWKQRYLNWLSGASEDYGGVIYTVSGASGDDLSYTNDYIPEKWIIAGKEEYFESNGQIQYQDSEPGVLQFTNLGNILEITLPEFSGASAYTNWFWIDLPWPANITVMSEDNDIECWRLWDKTGTDIIAEGYPHASTFDIEPSTSYNDTCQLQFFATIYPNGRTITLRLNDR